MLNLMATSTTIITHQSLQHHHQPKNDPKISVLTLLGHDPIIGLDFLGHDIRRPKEAKISWKILALKDLLTGK